MLQSEALALICLGGVAAAKSAQAFFHGRRTAGIGLRILVNGTRGKTEVTRMIASGLREAGLTVWARTTGTHPERIMPDGRVVREDRKCPPRLDEIVGFIKYISKNEAGADAVVVECMAINPFLQQILTRNILKNSITVITNVRPDHLDIVGSNLISYTEALCASMPRNGTVFTTESDNLDVILRHAVKLNTGVIIPHAADYDLKAQGFYFNDNIALAYSVCANLGISREITVEGIKKMKPDEGAFRIIGFKQNEVRYLLANATAANDPVSTRILLDILAERYQDRDIVGVFCSRNDRLWRKKALGSLRNCGIFSGFIELDGKAAGDVLEKITSAAAEGTVFFAFGNFSGIGEILLEKAEKCRAS